MRDAKHAANLGELMGEGFEHRTSLTLEDLPKLLGAKMPQLSYDRVGKLRLINALHQRFGPGFQNIPGVAGIMDHFNKELETESLVRMNRRPK